MYRHLPRTSKLKHYVHERLPPAVRDVALKTEGRLCGRYRALAGRGKKLSVAVTAIARELAGFVWAIGRIVQGSITTIVLARCHWWGRGNGRGTPVGRFVAGIAPTPAGRRPQ
jgi:hypothetical protein